MACAPMALPGGGVAIVCTRGRRLKGEKCHCGVTATHLCDGRVRPDRGGRQRRCDRPICAAHATRVGPDRDHCPECVAMHEARLNALLPPESLAGALVVYTDGSGTIATEPCGIGVVLFDGLEAVAEASAYIGLGSNNCAELSAVRHAVWLASAGAWRARRLLVRTDSMYTIESLTALLNPHPRAPNAELITTIRGRLAQRGRVWFDHVKGHSGEMGNERADVLAGRARLRGVEQLAQTRPAQPRAAVGGA